MDKEEIILKAQQIFPIIENMEAVSKAFQEKLVEMGEWVESRKCNSGEISDGYHTFNELYHYRMLYNALWVDAMDDETKKALNVHKSKRHSDGEECFGGGWFIISVTLPSGQVANHYELKDWNLFHCEERETADEWDGHTPQMAAERMETYLSNR